MVYGKVYQARQAIYVRFRGHAVIVADEDFHVHRDRNRDNLVTASMEHGNSSNSRIVACLRGSISWIYVLSTCLTQSDPLTSLQRSCRIFDGTVVWVSWYYDNLNRHLSGSPDVH